MLFKILFLFVVLGTPNYAYFDFELIHTHDDIYNNMTEDESPCRHLSTCKTSAEELIKRCYCDEFCTFFNDCCLDFNNFVAGNLTISPTKTQSSSFLEIHSGVNDSLYLQSSIQEFINLFNDSKMNNSFKEESNHFNRKKNENIKNVTESLIQGSTYNNATWLAHAMKLRPYLQCHLSEISQLSAGSFIVKTCTTLEESGIESVTTYMAYKAMCQSTSSPFLGAFYHVTTILPFTDNYGIVFRNMYCALCNGIPKDNIMPWKIYIITEWCLDLSEIPSNLSLLKKLDLLMMEKKCPFYFIAPPISILRTCYKGDVISINNRVEDLCHRFNAPVELISQIRETPSFNLWKNIFCWASNLTAQYKIVYKHCPKAISCEYLQESIMEKYKEDGGTALMIKFNPSVPVNIPDLIEEKALECQAGYVNHQNHCQVLEEIRNALISYDVKLYAYASTPVSVIKRAILSMMRMIQKMDLVVEVIENHFNMTQGTWDMARETCIYINFQFNVRTFGWLDMVQLVKIEQWLKQMDFRYDEEDILVWDFYSIVRDTNKIRYKLPKCHIDSWDMNPVDLTIQNQTTSLFNATEIDYLLNSTTENDDYFTTCPGLRIHAIQNFDIYGRNLFNLLSWNCTDDVLPERTAEIASNELAKKFVYGCSGFAISLLSFSLFFNIPNLEFQSLPGYNLAHTIVMSIMALTGLFLCPIADEFTYSRIALKHFVAFFWVATFTWGSISSYHLWFLFAKVLKNPKDDPYYNRILFSLYLAIGYGVPSLFLLVIISLGPGCCYMDDEELRGGLGCIPLSSSGFISIMSFPFYIFVFFNILFLCLTIFYIYDIRENQNKYFSFLVFYWVQVGLAVGITIMWVTNLLAKQWRSLVVWETFLILCILFGLEINLIFTMSQHIINRHATTAQVSMKW